MQHIAKKNAAYHYQDTDKHMFKTIYCLQPLMTWYRININFDIDPQCLRLLGSKRCCIHCRLRLTIRVPRVLTWS